MSIRETPRYVYDGLINIPRGDAIAVVDHWLDFPVPGVSIVDKKTTEAFEKLRADVVEYEKVNGCVKRCADDRNKGDRFGRINDYPPEIRHRYIDLILGPEKHDKLKTNKFFPLLLSSLHCKNFSFGHSSIYSFISHFNSFSFSTNFSTENIKKSIFSLITYLKPDLESQYIDERIHSTIGLYDNLSSLMATHDMAKRFGKMINFQRNRNKKLNLKISVDEQPLSFGDFVGLEQKWSHKLAKINKLYNLAFWHRFEEADSPFMDIFWGTTQRAKFTDFVNDCLDLDDKVGEALENDPIDYRLLEELDELLEKFTKSFNFEANFKLLCEQFFPVEYSDGTMVIAGEDCIYIRLGSQGEILHSLDELDLRDITILMSEVMSNMIAIAFDEDQNAAAIYKTAMLRLYGILGKEKNEQAAYVSCFQRDLELLVHEQVFCESEKFEKLPNLGIPYAAEKIINEYVFAQGKPSKILQRCRELRPLLCYSYNPIFLFNEYARCFALNTPGEPSAIEKIGNGVKYLCSRQYYHLTGMLPPSVLKRLNELPTGYKYKDEIRDGNFGELSFWEGVVFKGDGEKLYDNLSRFIKDSANVPPDYEPNTQSLKDLPQEKRREVLFFSSVESITSLENLVREMETYDKDNIFSTNPIGIVPKPEQKEGARTVCMESSYVRQVNSIAQNNSVPIASTYWGSLLGRQAHQKCGIMEKLSELILAAREKNYRVAIFMVDFMKFGHTIPLALTKKVQEIIASYYNKPWLYKYIDHLKTATFFAEIYNLRAIIENTTNADGQGLRNGTWQAMLAAAPFAFLADNEDLQLVLPKGEQISAVFFQDDHLFIVPYSSKKIKKSQKIIQKLVEKPDKWQDVRDRVSKAVKKTKQLRTTEATKPGGVAFEEFDKDVRATESMIAIVLEEQFSEVEITEELYQVVLKNVLKEVRDDVAKFFYLLKVEHNLSAAQSWKEEARTKRMEKYLEKIEQKKLWQFAKFGREEGRRFELQHLQQIHDLIEQENETEKQFILTKSARSQTYYNISKNLLNNLVESKKTREIDFLLGRMEFPMDVFEVELAHKIERGLKIQRDRRTTYHESYLAKIMVMPIIEKAYGSAGLKIEAHKTSVGFEAFSLLADIYDTKGLIPIRSKGLQTMLRPTKERAPSLGKTVSDLWTVLGSACLSGSHPNYVWCCGIFALPLKILMFANIGKGVDFEVQLLAHFIPSTLGGIPFGLPKHLTPGLTFFRDIDFSYLLWYHKNYRTVFGGLYQSLMSNITEKLPTKFKLTLKPPVASLAYKSLIRIADEKFGMKVLKGIKERDEMIKELFENIDSIPPTLRLFLKDLHPVSIDLRKIEKMCLSATARELLGVKELYEMKNREVKRAVNYYVKFKRLYRLDWYGDVKQSWSDFLREITPKKLHAPYVLPTKFFMAKATSAVTLTAHFLMISQTTAIKAPKYTAYGAAYNQPINVSPFRPTDEFKRQVDTQAFAHCLLVAQKHKSTNFLHWLERFTNVYVNPDAWGATGEQRPLRDLNGLSYNSQVLAPWSARLTYDKTIRFSDLEGWTKDAGVIVNYGAATVLGILNAMDGPKSKMDRVCYFRLLIGSAWKECDFSVNLPESKPTPLCFTPLGAERPLTSKFFKMTQGLLQLKRYKTQHYEPRSETREEFSRTIAQEYRHLIVEPFEKKQKLAQKFLLAGESEPPMGTTKYVREAIRSVRLFHFSEELKQVMSKKDLSKLAWKMWGDHIVKNSTKKDLIPALKQLPTIISMAESKLDLYNALYERLCPTQEDFGRLIDFVKNFDCENDFLYWLNRVWRSHFKGPSPHLHLPTRQLVEKVLEALPTMYFKLLSNSLPSLKMETVAELNPKGRLAYTRAWYNIYCGYAKEVSMLLALLPDLREDSIKQGTTKFEEKPKLLTSLYVGLFTARCLATSFGLLYHTLFQTGLEDIESVLLDSIASATWTALLVRVSEKYGLKTGLHSNFQHGIDVLRARNFCLATALPKIKEQFLLKFGRVNKDLGLKELEILKAGFGTVQKRAKLIFEQVSREKPFFNKPTMLDFLKNKERFKEQLKNSLLLINELGPTENLQLTLSRLTSPEQEESKVDKERMHQEFEKAYNLKKAKYKRDKKERLARASMKSITITCGPKMPTKLLLEKDKILEAITVDNVLTYYDEITGEIFKPPWLFASKNLTPEEKAFQTDFEEEYYDQVKRVKNLQEHTDEQVGPTFDFYELGEEQQIEVTEKRKYEKEKGKKKKKKQEEKDLKNEYENALAEFEEELKTKLNNLISKGKQINITKLKKDYRLLIQTLATLSIAAKKPKFTDVKFQTLIEKFVHERKETSVPPQPLKPKTSSAPIHKIVTIEAPVAITPVIEQISLEPVHSQEETLEDFEDEFESVTIGGAPAETQVQAQQIYTIYDLPPSTTISAAAPQGRETEFDEFEDEFGDVSLGGKASAHTTEGLYHENEEEDF